MNELSSSYKHICTYMYTCMYALNDVYMYLAYFNVHVFVYVYNDIHIHTCAYLFALALALQFPAKQ